jgi:hypothetical protein
MPRGLKMLEGKSALINETDHALTCTLVGRGQHPVRVKFKVLPKRGLQN